jgi:hypothetical protein
MHSSIISPAPMNRQACSLMLGKDALGQPHRGRGHRHRIGADLGAGAHFLGDREGALEQLVQQQAECAGFLGGGDRLLHLSKDLGFAEHHRIEARGDAERVLRGLFARQRIQVGCEFAAVDVVEVGQPLRDVVGRGRVEVQLGAVAGRQDRDFGGAPALRQVVQRLHQFFGAERHLLADRERRSMVVDPEGEKLHDGRWPKKKTAILLDPPLSSARGGLIQIKAQAVVVAPAIEQAAVIG